ncbi:oxidoreductase, aldo/keto reductase family protein, partial [Ostertagia ostertagi]
PIHNLQVELHLYWPQHELHEICKKHNISLTSYATLGSPGRANFMADKFGWKEAPQDLEDANVKQLAKKYNKTPAQILLRYAVDRGIAIIPKSVKPKRVVENFSIFDFSLTNDEIKLLDRITKTVGQGSSRRICDFRRPFPVCQYNSRHDWSPRGSIQKREESLEAKFQTDSAQTSTMFCSRSAHFLMTTPFRSLLF